MKQRTVRELGGEVWAELQHCQWHDPSSPLRDASNDAVQAFIDLTMGVLARHVGTVIENDRDLPVDPLPQKF